MKTSKLQQGFSLLELLVFIVILGIFAWCILPRNDYYPARARVTEGLALASSAKVAVAENAANGAPFSAGWIAPNAMTYVSTKAAPTEADRKTNVYSGIAINPANGIITITYTNQIAMANIRYWRPILQWDVLFNTDYTFTIIDRNKIASMMSDTPTLVLLPITENKTLPVVGKPIKGDITWECHSATAPTNDLLTTVLGTINPKYVPAQCRR